MRPAIVHSAAIYDRFYVLATGLVAYVTLASLQLSGQLAALGWLVASPLVLALTWRLTRPPVAVAPATVHPAALTALRVAVWGASIWVAARLGPPGHAALDLAANIGVGAAVVAAHVALARIPAPAGLVKPARSARTLDAAASCACFWGVAVAVPAARAIWPGSERVFDALAGDYATSVASIASLLVLLAAALRLSRLRRFELGVHDRAQGALALTLTACVLSVPASLASLATLDRALALGALFAALACAWSATAPEPARVHGALRAAVVVVPLGAAVALTAVVLSRQLPEYSVPISLCGSALSIAVGLSARSLARPLAPEPFRWLDALEAGARACLTPEPHAAITGTLTSLQKLEQNVHTRPEVWRVTPAEVASVDVAGYLHVEPGTAPAEVYELARQEPEQVLRREVLLTLAVRRPDVRAALSWLESRDAFAVALIRDDADAIGLLVLPRGSRARLLTLEEARAARTLADRLGAVLELSASLTRLREREQAALARADRLEQDKLGLEAFIAEQARPQGTLLEALAATIRVASYSAAARSCVDAVERLGGLGVDLAIEVPVGVEPIGWVCAYHRAGPRSRGPLVVTDGASSAAREPGYWSEADGVARRAVGGTLFVRNIAALPLETQDALAIAVSGRARLGAFEQFSLVVTLSEPLQLLVERRELSRALGQLLSPHVLGLPKLIDRPEDLRALVLDSLCRSGVRRAGQPLGIEPRALSSLVDHDWPGNDAELQHLVERAARLASSERVTLGDLARAGFRVPQEAPEPERARERVSSFRPSELRVHSPDPEREPRLTPRRRRRR